MKWKKECYVKGKNCDKVDNHVNSTCIFEPSLHRITIVLVTGTCPDSQNIFNGKDQNRNNFNESSDFPEFFIDRFV